MNPNRYHPTRLQTGFTLVEIMVGLVIGLLTTLVIMQVFSVFESQKRASTGTADAQTNGSIALYTIGEELQQAGDSIQLGTNPPINCIALSINGVADATLPNRLSPVTITDGASDTITIRRGNSPTGGVPISITGATDPATALIVNDNFNCPSGKTAIAISGGGNTCEMTTVTTPATDPVTSITVANAVSTLQAELACVGDWTETSYAVINGNLARNGDARVADIVNIQAQYGVSANAATSTISEWVDATGIWAAPDVATRNRIRAVRLAVVARNPKKETGNVTASAPVAWTGSALSPAPAIDLSADVDWQRYRYRVFETIIPLRNMIW